MAIETNDIDLRTGNKLIVIYMHLEVTNHGDVWENRSFENSVNPLCFYPDIKFTTDQATSWYGMYWSGDTTETKININ